MTSPPTGDSDLRGLLEDSSPDLHDGRDPGPAPRPSARRWVPLTLGAAVATALVIGGAAWLAQSQPDAPPVASPGPAETSATQDSAASPPARTVTVPVYYVGTTASGPRLFAEQHRVDDVTGTDLQAAVDEAMSGSALDPDYQNPFRELGVVADATNDNGTVTINFSEPVEPPDGMSSEDAQAALQSLVWTAGAAVSGTGPVTFTVAGQSTDQVLGVDTRSRVDRASADSVLATVSVTTPAEGATVPGTFQVSGQASTFEANVVWELKQGDRTVRDGYTTAQECCTLSPYTFTVSAPPGDYTLVVHDTDESDGEGVGTSQDTKNLTVQ